MNETQDMREELEKLQGNFNELLDIGENLHKANVQLSNDNKLLINYSKNIKSLERKQNYFIGIGIAIGFIFGYIFKVIF